MRAPWFISIALLAAAARAQVGAPVLGYLPVDGYILPVHGIPASASVAPALDFGGEFLRIAISPRQDFALVSSAASGAVSLAYPSGTTTAVAGATAYPSSITFSPSGSAAVLWFSAPQLLEIVSGLPSAPVVRTVDTSFLSGASTSSSGDVPAALGVSDDGAWGAGAWSSGVWAFGPNGEVRSLLSGANAYALAFFVGREDLAAATVTGVYSIADVGGSAAVSTLYTPADATAGQVPAGLAISADNRKVVMAGRRGAIITIDVNTGDASTGVPVSFECGCAPEGVFPMGGSLFRITALTGSVFRVFDAQAGSVFQVPLAPGTHAPAAAPVPSGGRTAGGGLRESSGLTEGSLTGGAR